MSPVFQFARGSRRAPQAHSAQPPIDQAPQSPGPTGGVVAHLAADTRDCPEDVADRCRCFDDFAVAQPAGSRPGRVGGKTGRRLIHGLRPSGLIVVALHPFQRVGNCLPVRGKAWSDHPGCRIVGDHDLDGEAVDQRAGDPRREPGSPDPPIEKRAKGKEPTPELSGDGAGRPPRHRPASCPGR